MSSFISRSRTERRPSTASMNAAASMTITCGDPPAPPSPLRRSSKRGSCPNSATSSSSGRWATTRASSALRKSDRLIPACAARTFNSRCTSSGTLRIWIILVTPSR